MFLKKKPAVVRCKAKSKENFPPQQNESIIKMRKVFFADCK